MAQTEEEGGGEGGKASRSWRLSSLVVGAGSSLSHSAGRGRGKLGQRSRAPGCTASPGHRSEKHRPFSFAALQALRDISAECFVS